ncbi:MAG: hypothetical protein EAZ62_05685 [Sphingobacteriia bacterium]|nr:MAG: hypothetical protein EAZ62_05685 [Sphingobacteriia bacterium]
MAWWQQQDSTKGSSIWPHVPASLFYQNVAKNIRYAESLYQGHSTNFCGYAAFSVLFIKDQPERYARMILSLYQTGQYTDSSINITSSPEIRLAAGTWKGKGELQLNGADQIWLLSLADHFKGYINTLNHKYNNGDENTDWCGTNLSKFRKMARQLGGYKTKAIGSDFYRPWVNEYDLYLALAKGPVVLFVNSKYLYPNKFRIYNLRLPTHFILLYDIKLIDGYYAVTYWDYGLKTFQMFTENRMRKLVYGVVEFPIKAENP